MTDIITSAPKMRDPRTTLREAGIDSGVANSLTRTSTHTGTPAWKTARRFISPGNMRALAWLVADSWRVTIDLAHDGSGMVLTFVDTRSES